jgi:predicted RNA binding protein YcfA (HicA-like mRNA interferase family)
MPKLSPRSTRECERLLQHHGFLFACRDGPHDIWEHPTNGRSVSLPRNRRSGGIPVGTLKGILRQAGITHEEALEFWGISG